MADLLDKISAALQTQPIDADEFESVAGILLGELYPGIVPITGGTDFGRDAELRQTGEPSIGFIISTDERVERNVVGSIESMQKNNVDIRRVVVVTTQSLSAT